MSTTDWQSLCSQIELEFREGRVSSAQALLREINSAQIPRGFRQPLARLARRLHNPELGLRFLAPVIRPADKLPEVGQPTPVEMTEYGGLLQEIGSLNEALILLTSVSPQEVPEVLLFQAYSHMMRWNSAQAAECLEAYLELDIAPELRLNAKINLASACTGIPRYEYGLKLAAECAREAEAAGQIRMAAYCQVLRANILLAIQDLPAADEALRTASPYFVQGTPFERHMFEQRLRRLECLHTGDPKLLLEFRPKLRAGGFNLDLRETDLDILNIQFDERRFSYLYFGTPHAAYRARIQRELGRAPADSTYVYGARKAPILDLSSSTSDLKAGKKTHQLLNILLQDFYVPIRLGALFAELFPGEYYDAASSPGRIHQVLVRARQFLKVEAIPVALHEQNGFYSLKIEGDFSFRVPLERIPKTTNEIAFEKLAAAFGAEDFDAGTGREALGLSPSGFKKFVGWAMEAGLVSRQGRNRQTRYRVTSNRRAA